MTEITTIQQAVEWVRTHPQRKRIEEAVFWFGWDSLAARRYRGTVIGLFGLDPKTADTLFDVAAVWVGFLDQDQADPVLTCGG